MSDDGIARVHAIAMTLPDVGPGTTHGFPAFKVRGKTFAWFPKLRALLESGHEFMVKSMKKR